MGFNRGLFALTEPLARNTSSIFPIISFMTIDEETNLSLEKFILQYGYQYQSMSQTRGWQQSFPTVLFFVKMPYKYDIFFLLPDYIFQSTSQKGFGAPSIGLKHEVFSFQSWIGSIENISILPTGSAAFGSSGLGEGFNVNVNYKFDSVYSSNMTLGFFSETTSKSQGGQRFSNLSLDEIFLAFPDKKIKIYSEFYLKSKTSPTEKLGASLSMGVIYQIFKNLSVYLEVGKTLIGSINGAREYVSVGQEVKF